MNYWRIGELRYSRSNIIAHSRPTLGQKEIDAVSKVIQSSMIAQGNMVERFEKDFIEKMGGGYAACTSSGTAALHLTLLAMSIQSGDDVIMPSFICSALLNAVNYTGANPVPVDINPLTYNIDPEEVKKHVNKKTRAIIVPHLFGAAADMDDLLALNVPVIEDCAQSIGGTYKKKYLGTLGHAAIFSFYATKVMTTGEGGMVFSFSKAFIDRIKKLREYDNRKKYEIRYNYKMTDIQAAMGKVQLSQLDDFISKRKMIADEYNLSFKKLGIRIPKQKKDHIYFRYVVGTDFACSKMIEQIQGHGIMCEKPVHTPIHRLLDLDGFSETEKAWKQTISIPIYPSLTEKETDRIIRDFKKTCNLTGLNRNERSNQ